MLRCTTVAGTVRSSGMYTSITFIESCLRDVTRKKTSLKERIQRRKENKFYFKILLVFE
jgi:hypothetical protein